MRLAQVSVHHREYLKGAWSLTKMYTPNREKIGNVESQRFRDLLQIKMR